MYSFNTIYETFFVVVVSGIENKQGRQDRYR